MRRLIAAFGLVLAGLGTGALDPVAVQACSCIADVTFEQHLEFDPGAAMVVGTVVRDRGDGSFDFAVQRWYGGSDHRPVVVLQSGEQRLPDGTTAFNTCGMSFTMGQRLLFLAARGADGTYGPSICSLSADPGTPLGADYERKAATLIGAPFEVVPETGASPPATSVTSPDAGVVLASVAAAVVVLFGGLVLFARRRRPNAT